MVTKEIVFLSDTTTDTNRLLIPACEMYPIFMYIPC